MDALRSIPALQTTHRLLWVEPEMRQLQVGETAMQPATGGDANLHYQPDCTRS